MKVMRDVTQNGFCLNILLTVFTINSVGKLTRSQAVARIADRTAKNSSGHMT